MPKFNVYLGPVLTVEADDEIEAVEKALEIGSDDYVPVAVESLEEGE